MMAGSLKLFWYECTSISAAALLAAYGLVGARILVSSRSSSSSLTSPYTSSVETWMKRLMPTFFALSSSTCVPYTLVCVKPYELPKLRSTCDCAAKWNTVSMLYRSRQSSTSEGFVTSPW
jgi:hypothetical protein